MSTNASIARLANSEWTKLRSLRSSAWTLTAMVVASIGLASIFCAVSAAHWNSFSASDRLTWDPTNTSLAGTLFGQLAIVVFGVLAVTGEFASGTIRASVSAIPRRTPLLAAKAAVYAGVALVAGEVISFVSFVVGQAILSGRTPSASLSDPTVVRAVVLTGAYLALICLMSLGVGFLLRNTAGAIAAMIAVLLVLPGIMAALPSSLQNSIGQFLPSQIGGDSLAAVVREQHALSAWAGLGMLCVYAAVLLGSAAMVLRRRDV